MTTRLSYALVAVALLAAACSGSATSETGVTSTAPSEPATTSGGATSPSVATTQGGITPTAPSAEARTQSSDDGALTVDLPAGSPDLTIGPGELPPDLDLDGGEILAGPYELELEGALPAPATLTATVDVQGRLTPMALLVRVDDGGGLTAPGQELFRDGDTLSISLDTDAFSTWAVVSPTLDPGTPALWREGFYIFQPDFTDFDGGALDHFIETGEWPPREALLAFRRGSSVTSVPAVISNDGATVESTVDTQFWDMRLMLNADLKVVDDIHVKGSTKILDEFAGPEVLDTVAEEGGIGTPPYVVVTPFEGDLVRINVIGADFGSSTRGRVGVVFEGSPDLGAFLDCVIDVPAMPAESGTDADVDRTAQCRLFDTGLQVIATADFDLATGGFGTSGRLAESFLTIEMTSADNVPPALAELYGANLELIPNDDLAPSPTIITPLTATDSVALQNWLEPRVHDGVLDILRPSIEAGEPIVLPFPITSISVFINGSDANGQPTASARLHVTADGVMKLKSVVADLPPLIGIA